MRSASPFAKGLMTFTLLTFAMSPEFGVARDKPNILIFYIDDMGYGQPGCYGGKLAPTPHMDAIATGGVRFTNAYVSACVCSPSRVGLMTGRYQQRTGHDSNSNRPGRELALTEKTMAERMKAAGYETGIVGKWHLGATSPKFMPGSRGFDYAFGSTHNLGGKGKGPRFYQGIETIPDPDGAPITSPIYAHHACEFIQANQNKPFFLYFAFNAVHTPHVASETWLQKFSGRSRRERAYAANLAEADETIGVVMQKLRACALEEDTLIFCLSDNGGASSLAEMGGLRGRKWFVWEGGIRVSWMVQWKSHIPAGLVVDEPIIQLDVLPSALAAAGIAVARDWELDGVNLLPLLEGKADRLERDALYWRFGVQYAVREGDWKLVKASKTMQPMLVNLTLDPGEQTDLSFNHPEKAQELQARWDRWNATMQQPRWQDRRWNGDEKRKGKRNQRLDKETKKKR